MRVLPADELLGLWEAARQRPALEQALIVWARFDPARRDPPALRQRSIFERDRALFEIRRDVSGDVAECFVNCPQCQAELEVTFTIPPPEPPEPEPGPWSFEQDDWHIEYRAPTSDDLAAALSSGSAQALSFACLLGATLRGDLVPVERVPLSVREAVGAALDQRAGLASIRFRMVCEACSADFSAPFDIGRFLWREIEVSARRLLVEVDEIARAYGWSEQDILRMSAARRASYLQILEAE